MNSKYYNYSINMNGKKIKHGFDYSKDYYPDLIANDSIAFLRQSKKNSAHKPVMLTMSFPSPHGPEDSAPQYSDLFFNVTSHHIPSYDYAPNPDKQWILQVTNKMQPIHKQFTDLLMTKRLQTLQSVDAAVQRVVEELSVLGELHNTYIIYTSDHGYHLGQFGLIKGKSFPFEFDVRVPFLVRGPGIDPGAVIDEIVLNIDLAPTFLDIAGVDPPPHMDGRSILPLFLSGNRKRLKWPDTFLIESSGRRETPFLDAKLRKLSISESVPIISTTVTSEDSTTIFMYNNDSSTTEAIETTSAALSKIYESEEGSEDDEDETDEEKEVHDLNVETQKIRELESQIQEEEYTNQDRPPLKREQMLLDNRVLPGFIPLYSKSERLVKECAQPNMQKPCIAHQKWFCEFDNGRWRKHKCKSIVPNSHQTVDKYRKCACFTPHGLVYKKIPIDNLLKKGLRILKRNKRNSNSNHRFFSIEHTDEISIRRTKRDNLEQVDNVMRDIRGQINDLQFANTSIIDEQMRSRNLETNVIGDMISGCRILGRGNVNCSNQVYHDKKIWQKSRHEVNNEIQELKDKLEKLKEIRRHLKYYRPDDETVVDIDDSDDSKLIPEQNVSRLIPKYNRKKHKKGHDSRKDHKTTKLLINIETTTETENIQNVTSPSPDNKTESASKVTQRPHKHKHQKHFSSTTPNEKNTDEIPYPINNCHCEVHESDHPETVDRELIRQHKKRIDEEKMRRRARKQRRKESLDKQCSSERMNCFHHDNDHWKTVPLWTNGPFCFCMNSNNNTYSCVRTINVTHNFCIVNSLQD
ncbi:hypothetical protein HHI36_006230 [Cryptolaemus montrouzieri]|uniref:Uncharacterized protein n=1 Tax=Cryptolaemus montrouzieri TaxID=559131 RepID=A0ABD2NWZ5_9CUCU